VAVIIMCFTECLINGSCVKDLTGQHIKVLKNGKILSWGKGETRAFFGDASWAVTHDGKFKLIEHHNIEKTVIKLCYGSVGQVIKMTTVHKQIREYLDNKEIYTPLIIGRIKSMARHGYVDIGEYYIVDKSDSFRKDGYAWGIRLTAKGSMWGQKLFDEMH
jgi:hypothetical protein